MKDIVNLLLFIGFVEDIKTNWIDYNIESKSIKYQITVFNDYFFTYNEIINNSDREVLNSSRFDCSTQEDILNAMNFLKMIFNTELRKNKIKKLLDE